MKILNLGAEAVAQSLLPMMTPKTGDTKSSSRASSTDLSSIDPQDPQSFSRLLQADSGSDRVSGRESGGSFKKSGAADKSAGSVKSGPTDAAKGSASAQAQARESTRADRSSPAGASAQARDPQDGALSGNGVSFSVSGSSQGSSDADAQTVSDGVLSADTQSLPSDPRLNQTPDELALEAAAIAAAQLLVIETIPQATEVPSATSEVGEAGAASLFQSGQSGSNSGAGVSFLDQLALRTLQPSLRPSIANQLEAPATQSAANTSGASSLGQNPATLSGQVGVNAGAGLAAGATPVDPLLLNNQAALGSGFLAVSAQAEGLTPLSLGASLTGLSATSAQAAAITAAGKQRSQANSAPTVASQPKADNLTTPTLSANILGTTHLTTASSGTQLKTGGEIFASQPAASAEQAAAKSDSLKGASSDASQSGSLGVGQTVSAKGDSADTSENGASNGSADQNSKNQTKDATPVIPVKVSQLASSRANTPISKPASSSGTLGATERPVPKDSTAFSAVTLEETAPVKTAESALGAVVDRGSLAQVPAAVVGGARALAEVDAKPTVLPPVSVRGNEVWKVVTDALQRARSENPSHLAVEVRMDDGSTLGLEVRMNSTGLHASFRSESQTLLKNLEAQWSGFVTKESPDAKVTAAVFEGRSSFGNSTDSNTNGGERRQQMEDAASSASLSRGTMSGKSETAGSTAPKQITPSIRTRDGRMAVYA